MHVTGRGGNHPDFMDMITDMVLIARSISPDVQGS